MWWWLIKYRVYIVSQTHACLVSKDVEGTVLHLFEGTILMFTWVDQWSQLFACMWKQQLLSCHFSTNNKLAVLTFCYIQLTNCHVHMLLVLYPIVLFVMNFINENTLERSFDNRRNNLIFHVVCFELYTSLCNVQSFYGENFGLCTVLRILTVRENSTQLIVHDSFSVPTVLTYKYTQLSFGSPW